LQQIKEVQPTHKAVDRPTKIMFMLLHKKCNTQ